MIDQVHIIRINFSSNQTKNLYVASGIRNVIPKAILAEHNN